MTSFKALSREGHAAMSIRGESDRWVVIQKNTFTNWVNEQLRVGGIEHTEFIQDLETAFDDGVKLCRLVESLQGKKIGRVIKKPLNHHQNLENVTLSLSAIANDNVRLVNIGPEDIVNGNLKLILGLIWHLILRYQIGKTKFPTKKLMLAWLHAVIPECHVTNFTSDWNSGIALHALIDFCRPGLSPNWRNLSRSDGLSNCQTAMQLAKQNFDIPLVVRPEDLSSSDLDELSAMTYLSYFMKVDSPGYHATMAMLRKLLKHGSVNNFTSDWQDGRLLCNLCVSLGQSVAGWPTLTGTGVENQQLGIEGAQKLGVNPILTAKEMCDPEVDHIGIMAYVAYFGSFKPSRAPAEKVIIDVPPRDCYIGIESTFSVRIDDPDISPGDVRGEVKGPDSNYALDFSWSGRSAKVSFTPRETGHHRLNVFCENQLIVGCPVSFKVLADRSKITFTQIDRCTLGMITEFRVNSRSAGQGDIQVEARAPGGRVHNLAAVYRNGEYVMNFTPSEVGVWQIMVKFDGDHINGSPFRVHVFDPSAVQVYGLEGGTVGMGLAFNADTSRAGDGELKVTVMHEGRQVPAYITTQRSGLYRIDYTPEGAGTYKVFVYYNEIEVKGSPYTMDIVDSSRVTVSGDGLSLVPVNRTARFIVDTNGGSSGSVKVEITGPSGTEIEAEVKLEGDGKHTVEYTPTSAGDHQVLVYYCDQLVKGSPFPCKVYDAGNIVVSEMPDTTPIKVPVSFNIDASRAGSGNIEIMVNGGRIACSVQNQGNYVFLASFTPENPEPHIVEMKFNSLPVYGSPWTINAFNPKDLKVSGSGLDFVKVNHPATFNVGGCVDVSHNLLVMITAPNGKTIPYNIGSDGSIEYTPMEVGDHKIEVQYGDNEVEGSPFTAKAYDTSAIVVSPLYDGLVGNAVDFTIDVTRAGEGQLEIMVNNGNLPNTVDMEKTGVYKISFTPENAGRQYVDINFNSEGLPGSPFSCMSVDAKGITVDGLQTILPTDKLTAFTIQTNDGDVSPVVDVYTPSGDKIPVKISEKTVDGHQIELRPVEVGSHTVRIMYGKYDIGDSPYTFETFNPRKVKVRNIPDQCFLDNSSTFIVDASEAGKGILEVAILADGKHIPHTLDYLGGGLYEVRFTGRVPVRHRVHITFNDIYIPGSPFWIEYEDEIEVTLAAFRKTQFFARKRNAGFTFYGPSGLYKYFSAEIQGPSGAFITANIRETSAGTYSVEFVPQEVGSHLVKVFFNNVLVKGFPYTVKVFDAQRVRVNTNCQGIVDVPVHMHIDVMEAGEGELELIVECDGETIPSKAEQDGIGKIAATFTPRRGKLHKAYLKFNGELVPGSPFHIDVSEGSEVVKETIHTKETVIMTKSEPLTARVQTKQFFVDQQQWFILEAFGANLDEFDQLEIVIRAPSGDRIPARIISQYDGTFKVEWTPSVAGRHNVEVSYSGRQIDGSPFVVDVFDLALLRIENFRQSGVGETASFDFDLSQAGLHNFDVVVRSPTGQIVDHRISGNMVKDISYIPSEAGPHEIYVNYYGFEIPGCPYIQNIDEGGMPTASGDGLYRGEEDKVATFTLDVGRRNGDLEVKVNGPYSIAKTTLQKSGDQYIVSYVPVEVGIFDIQIRWNGKEIPGSPYHPKILNCRKVQISGGWSQYMDANQRVGLVVNDEKRLLFDISQAGPGSLKAKVEGPNASVPVSLEDNNGQVTVFFVPVEEGNHYIHLYWSDLTLPSSPFLGYAVPAFTDSNKVILTGRGLKESTVREESEFVIDGSQAGPGAPEVTLTGVRAEINVKVLSIGNGKYRCTYIPVVPGAYLLHITWNGRQLRGSPYKVNVIGAFYPNKVNVSGEGLKGGILGRNMEVAIDTRKAGPGELTAFCMGPNKAAYCELEDNHDGTFYLRIRALESGRHVLQIKYGGEHVNGSPFVLKVSAQPDASKVRVTGPGVEHGILATFKSRFIVETRGAGAGQLTVRIRGPKGGFQVEMYRDSQRDRTILCRYDPTETGLYIVSIKWSGMDVPGSPFQIQIVDTQQELEQVLQDASFSQSSITPRSYGQWREDI